MMTFRTILYLLLALTLTTAQAGWGSGSGGKRGGSEQSGNQNQNQDLNHTEAEQLGFLREEEKLARDVYLYSYRRWGLPIFSNIASAEQRHMNAVLNMLNQYGLVDTALLQEGVFSNAELQNLYDALIVQVNQSLMDALMTGALIEEVDMQDLDEMIGATNKDNLIGLYESLHCGSRNHLRSYVRQIEYRGQVYEAQVMGQDEVDRIVDSSMERRCGRYR
jgi:hypothetical protein